METKVTLQQAIEPNRDMLKSVVKYISFLSISITSLTILTMMFIFFSYIGIRWLSWLLLGTALFFFPLKIIFTQADVNWEFLLTKLGSIASLLSLGIGIFAIYYAHHVAIDTTQKFLTVEQQFDKLEQRVRISEISDYLVSKRLDLYMENWKLQAVSLGYVEHTKTGFKITEKGKDLLLKVDPELKNNIVKGYNIYGDTVKVLLAEIRLEDLYELVRIYNKNNETDISLEILIGVISSYINSLE